MPYLEKYLYAKLGTLIRGKEFRLGNVVIRSRAFGIGHVVWNTICTIIKINLDQACTQYKFTHTKFKLYLY